MQYGYDNYSAGGYGVGAQTMSYGSSFNQYNSNYMAPQPVHGYSAGGGGGGSYYASSAQSMSTYGAGGAGGDFDRGLGILAGELAPASFPPGTDPKLIDCFNRMDKDGDGSISDYELFISLSTYGHKFSLRTVHLLINMFAAPKSKVIGPKEFVALFSSLMSWKTLFQRFDVTRSGRMEAPELRGALMRIGCNVQPAIVRLLISQFDRTGANRSVGYDDFIECCLIIKGLTNNFNCKQGPNWDMAEFTYDEFFLSVLPLIVA